jgi:hypothetical protein
MDNIHNEEQQVIVPFGYQICSDCLIALPMIRFYKSSLGKAFKICKDCHKTKAASKIRENKNLNGGSERAMNRPDCWVDEYQKAQTHQFLQLCGWTYTDGVWWKDGIKDKNNVWVNVIPTKKKRVLVRGTKGRTKLPIYENRDQIVKQYEAGVNYYDLAYIYKCSHTSIRHLVKSYYDERRGN